jgi:hypothetical protein
MVEGSKTKPKSLTSEAVIPNTGTLMEFADVIRRSRLHQAPAWHDGRADRHAQEIFRGLFPKVPSRPI